MIINQDCLDAARNLDSESIDLIGLLNLRQAGEFAIGIQFIVRPEPQSQGYHE